MMFRSTAPLAFTINVHCFLKFVGHLLHLLAAAIGPNAKCRHVRYSAAIEV
jgi:hypothetical protein